MFVRAAKWVAGRVMRFVPEALLGRMLPGEFRFDPSAVPAPVAAPDASIRLLIAPVNYAGQGWQWARAVERHVPGAGAVSMVVRMRGDFAHPADYVVPLGHYAASRRWQRSQRDAVTQAFTHVMIEAEKQPFGAVLDETVKGQVERLVRDGLGVLMLCHGSDIRLPSRHIENYPTSPFRDGMAGVAPVLEKVASENRRLLDRLGLPVFVSTPDLLLDVPTAHWLPVVVEPDAWATAIAPLDRQVPVVAHAPSSGPVKGSALIDPVLTALAAEGIIEYRRIEGVPFEAMPSVYRDADIVIDQVRLGDYGVAACEAMAAGRVVVGHVSSHARARVLESTGLALPVVEATADTLEDVIRAVIADRARHRALAERGPEFVRAVHDGRRSASVLEPFLTSGL
jgi:hypothetical protein